VFTGETGKVSGPGLDDGQRGDRVDRLGGPLRAGQRPPAAHDLDGLGSVRESQPSRHRSDLQGAPSGAAVAFLAGLLCDEDLPPGQGGELGMQTGLVALDVIS
jgi:hypothetical protein